MDVINEIEQIRLGNNAIAPLQREYEELGKKIYLCRLINAINHIEKMTQEANVKKYHLVQLELSFELNMNGNYKLLATLIDDKQERWIFKNTFKIYNKNKKQFQSEEDNFKEIKVYPKGVENALNAVLITPNLEDQAYSYGKIKEPKNKIVVDFTPEGIKNLYPYFLTDELMKALNYSLLHIELNKTNSPNEVKPKL